MLNPSEMVKVAFLHIKRSLIDLILKKLVSYQQKDGPVTRPHASFGMTIAKAFRELLVCFSPHSRYIECTYPPAAHLRS